MSEITKEMIEELVAKGHSKIEMTKILNRSMNVLNTLLRRYGISLRGKRTPISTTGNNPCAWKHCTNTTDAFFCSRDCANKYRVSRYRVNLVEMGIAYKGGSCRHCGYDRYTGALHFHHLDPSQKDFSIRGSGNTFKWDTIVSELDKCILLCGNCHAEYHAGLLDLTKAMETNPTPEEGMQRLADINRLPYRKIPRVEKHCKLCGVTQIQKGQLCWSCYISTREYPTKIQWPDIETLIQMAKEKPLTEIGRTLGVSSNAVKKHLKRYQV